MDRSIPRTSRILDRKWHERQQLLHYQTLQDVRPSINSSAPPSFDHVRAKAKRDQIQEGNSHIDRFTEIERANRILLDKMTHIPNHLYPIPQPFKKKSLNRQKRRREIHSITIENRALLNRLKFKQPCYNVYAWESDRQRQEDMLRSICEFPYRLGITRSPKKTRLSQTHLVIKSKKPKAPKKSIFKQGVTIGGQHFVVEMTFTLRGLRILASSLDKPESFRLELSREEANRLLRGDGDFGKLVPMLELENGELILISPPVKKEGDSQQGFA